jgi:hypothetical protein
MEQPKFRKGQCLTNKKTRKEIFIDMPLIERKVTKNYSGFVEEFTGEYSYTWFDEKGKKMIGEISEDVLINYYE